MNYRLKTLLLTISLLCLGIFAKAQINPSFTASQTTICEGFAVAFCPTLDPTVSAVWWDFGDGIFQSFTPINGCPGEVYNTAGTYTVRLAVEYLNGTTDTVSINNLITVNPNPVINFTANPTVGCQPLDVLFNFQTNSTVTSNWTWTWTFSSDSTCFAGNQQDTVIRADGNPFSHTFTEDGIYDVKLMVENQFNCKSDTTKFDVFEVLPRPIADFSYQIQPDCDATTNVTFTSTSTIPCTGTSTYNWDFGEPGSMGNSATTTQTTFDHEYQTSGTFTVRLIVRDATLNSCSDTIFQTITINPDPTVSISTVDSACVGEFIQFNGTSSGVVTDWLWDFGDNNASNLQNATNAYQTPGCYPVSLTITIDTCSFFTVLDTCLIINATPTASFTSLDPIQTCSHPHTMSFTSTVVGALNPIYSWDFGDGTTSSQQHPTKTWNYAGVYQVSLTVSTPQGCSYTTANETIVIDSINVSFTANDTSGCLPVTTQFINNSSSLSNITNWIWRFGDGSVSTLENPSHTYGTEGSYDVTLIVSNDQGCMDSLVMQDFINIGTPPNLALAVSYNFPCVNDSISFTNNSDPVGTDWMWFNGLDTVSGFNIPNVAYSTCGNYDISLSGANNGCYDTLSLKDYIVVPCINANFTTNGDCNINPTGVNFVNASSGFVVDWFYDFGDTTSTADTSHLANPSYTYPAFGTYSVSLIITDFTGCMDTFVTQVNVNTPIANFGWTTDTVGCSSVDFPISVIDSSLYNTGICNWDVPNATFLFGSDSICNPIFSFDTTGVFDITLIVRSDQGCRDTITKQICITDVIAAANIDTLGGSGTLITGPIDFVDNGATIIGGSGGCIIQLDTINNDTIYYNNIGTVPINCNDPNLSFYTGCSPLTVEFADSSYGFPDSISAWVWNFGDGTVSTEQHPTHTYTSSSGALAYMVTLTVYNEYGVVRTDTIPTFIRPTQAIAKFSLENNTLCSNQDIIAIDSSSGVGLTYAWDFGDGNTSTAQNPTFNYQNEGTYQVCLTVTDINGCDSLVCDSVVIVNPVAIFGADTTYSSCENLTVTFADSSLNATAWYWNFGNDSISTLQNPSVTYVGTGFYDVTLTIIGVSGCQDTLTRTNFVKVDGPLISSYSVSPTDSCEDHLVSFNIQGSNIGLVTIDFGNGEDTSFVTATSLPLDTTIQFTYLVAGTYNPILYVEDSLNCERTWAFNTITTTDPLASFTIDTTEGCVPFSIPLNATASQDANQYQWIAPGGFVAGQGTATPSIIYSNEGYYNEITLIVTDVNNCRDTLSFTDTITASTVNAGFYSDVTTGCFPLAVQFTDTSSAFPDAITTWFWEFVTGDTDVAQNPTYTYDNVANVNQRARLTVTNSFGCTDNVQKNILPTTPTSAFVCDTLACTDQAINFTNQSTGLNLSYLWDFGDTTTSTAVNPSHSYDYEGAYTVTLVTTDMNGCTDTTTFYPVVIANPFANFAVSTQLITCAPDSIQFSVANLSQNAVSYFWTIEGASPVNYTEAEPKVAFTVPGVYDVELIVISASGCQDTIRREDFITVQGPYAVLDFSPTEGCVDLEVDYTIALENVSLAFIGPGDGPLISFPNPGDTLLYKHYYTQRGTYTPTIFIQDSAGCQRTFTEGDIIVTDPEPVFTVSIDTACTPFTVLTTNNSLDVASYQWIAPTLNSTNITSTTPSFDVTGTGFHDISLIVTDVYGCKDTMTHTVLGSDVQPLGSISVSDGCRPLTVQFTDASTYFPDTTLTWLWNFDDNATFDNTQNPSHTYQNVGTYTPTLTVTNPFGCTETYTLPTIETTFPSVSYTPSLTYACTGQDILFDNHSTGQGLTYSWDFDNGVTVTTEDPTYAFPAEGVYNVCLTTTDINGCDSTYCQSITIANPAAAFTVDNQYLPCPPATFNFTDQSMNAVSWFWTFGDDSSSTAQNPSHTYTETGFYDVQLIMTSASGCMDTLLKPTYIEVGGPVGNFTFTPKQGCADVTATFTGNVTANTIDLYIWDFGDNNSSTSVSNSNTNTVTHTYTTAGTFFPTLTLQDATGCQFVTTLDSIEVDTLQFDFFADDTLTCETGDFTFTPYITSSSPIDSVVWNFASADVTTSNSMMPTIPYNTVGDFDVTLTVYSRHCTKTITKSQYIKIAPIPNTNFTIAPTAGCNPTTVTFTDATSIFSGSVTSWAWNLGDGSLDSTQNTANNYDTVGVFDIQLITVSDHGCTDTLLLVDTLTIHPIPHPAFDLDTFACTMQDVFFTNNSTGNGLTYSWDFGDGNTSTLFEPVHQYATEGTFTVCLTVTDVNGCDSVTCKSLLIANPVANFNSNVQYLPCPNDSINFTDLSVNAIGWHWSFGDGDTSIAQNPSHTYTATGFYDVQLIVQGASGCFDTLLQTSYIEIGGPVGNFTFTPKQGCADVTATFTGNVTANTIDLYIWNYGDGNIDTTFSNATTDIVNHTYTTAGTFFPTLTIEDFTGCQFMTSLDSIEVDTLQFDFFANDTLLCENGSLDFTPYITSSSPIDSVSWTFNGATVTTSTSMMPTITYNTVGDFDVILTVHSGHCSKTITKTQYIKIAPIPNPDFSTVPTVGCNPTTVSFTDITNIASGNVVSWAWTFGDGGMATTQNTAHTYQVADTFDVQLITVSDYGCTDSITYTDLVIINPIPHPAFTLDGFACTNQEVNFTNLSTGNGITYNWDFGDGTTSTMFEPVHQYITEDTFNVCLTVTDVNGCDSTTCQSVIIANPVANFTANTQYLSCAPDSVQFTDASINAVGWHWTFANGDTSIIQNPTHTYTATGFYDVQLIVQGASGCFDTLLQTNYIEVGGPIGSFAFTPNQGCADVTTTFVGTLTNNSVAQYHWNFGNGDSITHTSNMPIDSFEYVYTTSGTFFPTLTFEDSTGCTFFVELDSIEVDTLQFDFFANDTLLCETGNLNFTPYIASSSPIDSVLWTFNGASITTSTMMMPTIPYDTIGDFDVTLTVFSNHCSKTITKTQYIKAAPIPTSYFTTATNPFCSEQSISFLDAHTIFSGNVISWAWDFGDLNASTTQNPTHMYADSGFYDVNLLVTSEYGCTHDSTITVYINKTPEPMMTPAPVLCIGEVFTLTASGGDSYVWYNGTNFICDTCTSIDVAPVVTTNYTLIATSAAGCRDTITQTVNVQPYAIPPLVVSNDTTVCKGDVVQLFASGGYDVTQYTWDSNISGLTCYNGCSNPFASPTTTTTYYVTLTWDGGCSKTDSVTVTVIDDASPILGVDRTICLGESVPLSISTGGNAIWSPGDGLSCVFCDNPVASPLVTTTYAVEVTTANGCTIRDTMVVNVQTPAMISAGDDATICSGTTIELNGLGNGTPTWTPAATLTDANILNPIASPVVTTDYILTVQNDLCVQSDTVRVTISDKVDIEIEDIEICEGEAVEVDIQGYAETFLFTPDTGIISIQPTIIQPEETTTYMVIGNIPLCQSDTAIFTITVNPIPDIGLLPNMTVFKNTVTPLPIDYPNSQYMHIWTPSTLLSCPDCFDPYFVADSTFSEMMIQVDLLTDAGCSFSDSILVTLGENCGNDLVQLPTAFTPNGDGRNDIFRVRGVGVSDVEIFRVYNRWGEQLFETSQINEGWDGTYKGQPVEQGTYMYYVQAVCPLTGEILMFKGDVFLHF